MIIIPDIHGRDFWKESVLGHEDEDIVFLGDYVDPYTTIEDVETSDGLRSLTEVIAFKLQHPANVTLLLGNHDLSYLSRYISRCRHDYAHHREIRRLLLDNLSSFQIAAERNVDNRRFLFTHAGVLPDWVEYNEIVFGELERGYDADVLNALFHSNQLYQALADVSGYRGGRQDAGSCVWADLYEHLDYCFRRASRGPDVYQIFGHTLQPDNQPVITDRFACLDCRHAFLLDENGQLSLL